MSDDRAFLDRLGGAFASGGATAPGGCPDPEDLWAARRASGAPDARQRVVAHLAVCADCAADWSLIDRVDARAMETAAPPAQADAAGVRPRAPRRISRAGPWLLAAAAAAAILAIVAIGRFAGPGARLPVATVRSTAGPAVEALVPDGGVLPRRGAVLRWTDLGPGVRYTVDVATEDLRALALARGLERPEYPLPDTALSALPAGAIVVWRVEAVLPDGRHVASQGFRARVE